MKSIFWHERPADIKLLSEQVDILSIEVLIFPVQCETSGYRHCMCCITLITALLVKRRFATSQAVF